MLNLKLIEKTSPIMPLLEAARNLQFGELKLLIDAGHSISWKDSQSQQGVLEILAEEGNLKALTFLCRFADVLTLQDMLFVALVTNQSEIIKYIESNVLLDKSSINYVKDYIPTNPGSLKIRPVTKTYYGNSNLEDKHKLLGLALAGKTNEVIYEITDYNGCGKKCKDDGGYNIAHQLAIEGAAKRGDAELIWKLFRTPRADNYQELLCHAINESATAGHLPLTLELINRYEKTYGESGNVLNVVMNAFVSAIQGDQYQLATYFLKHYELPSEFENFEYISKYLIWLDEHHPELLDKVKGYITSHNILENFQTQKEQAFTNRYIVLNKQEVELLSKCSQAATVWLSEICPLLMKKFSFNFDIICTITNEILSDTNFKINQLTDNLFDSAKKERIRCEILKKSVPKLRLENKELDSVKSLLTEKISAYLNGYFCHHKIRAEALIEVIKNARTIETIKSCLVEQHTIFSSKVNIDSFQFFTPANNDKFTSCYDLIRKKPGNGLTYYIIPLINECLEEVKKYQTDHQSSIPGAFNKNPLCT